MQEFLYTIRDCLKQNSSRIDHQVNAVVGINAVATFRPWVELVSKDKIHSVKKLYQDDKSELYIIQCNSVQAVQELLAMKPPKDITLCKMEINYVVVTEANKLTEVQLKYISGLYGTVVCEPRKIKNFYVLGYGTEKERDLLLEQESLTFSEDFEACFLKPKLIKVDEKEVKKYSHITISSRKLPEGLVELEVVPLDEPDDVISQKAHESSTEKKIESVKEKTQSSKEKKLTSEEEKKLESLKEKPVKDKTKSSKEKTLGSSQEKNLSTEKDINIHKEKASDSTSNKLKKKYKLKHKVT